MIHYFLFNERAEAVRLLDAYGEDVVLRLADEIQVASQNGHERRACRLDKILQAVEDEIDRRVGARVRRLTTAQKENSA